MQVAKLKPGYKLAKVGFGKYEEIPEEWQEKTLGDLIKNSRNGFTGSPNDKSIGLPRLGISSITSNDSIYVSENIHRFIEIEKSKIDGYLVHKNDLLVCRQNGNENLVGKICVAKGSIHPLIFSDSLIRLRVKNDQVVPEYVVFFLNCQCIFEHLD